MTSSTLTLKAIFPLLVVALFLVSEIAAAQNQPARQWEPYNELGDLYPSHALAVTSLADSAADGKGETNIGDPNGIIGIVFTPDRDDTRITIQLTCASDPKLFSPATLDVTLPEAGEEYRITPPMVFNQAKLVAIKKPITASITYTITINGQRQPPRTESLLIHSINDCPMVATDNNDDESMDWVMAAYVNEDHPAVEQLLQEALRKKYVNSFDGYQGDESRVYQQVLAIWRVIQERGNRYTNLTNTTTGAGQIPIQPLRLIDESTQPGPASCADGSVLMASLLRKIGLNPILVVIPGHMFVGFDVDEGGEKQAYLETTLMGVEPDYGAAAEKQLAGQLMAGSTDAKAQVAVKSLVAAIESGNQTYAQHSGRIQDEKSGYAAVDIDDARQAGIRPIGTK